MIAEKKGAGITNLDVVQFDYGWTQNQIQFQEKITQLIRFQQLHSVEGMTKRMKDFQRMPINNGVTILRNMHKKSVNNQLKRGNK